MSVPAGSIARRQGWRAFYRLSPVRLAVFFVVLMAGDIGAQIALHWVRHHSPGQVANWPGLAAAIVLATALLAIYAGLVHRMERRRATELSPGAGFGLAGVLSGFLLFTVVIGLMHLAGVAGSFRISANFNAGLLASSIIAGVGEELALRGGVFRIVEDSCGTLVALIFSAALFGLLHALNHGATVISTAAIAVEAGLMLASAYLLARNLWLPIGLHFGWNFTEGGIFGTSVSGSAPTEGVFSVTLAGPKLLTGGEFGPEASLIAVAVGLCAVLGLIFASVRAGRWKPITWRMTPA